jgi:hypothetical protein
LGLKGIRDEPIPQYQLASFRGWRNVVRASLASGAVPASFLKTGLPPAQLAARSAGGNDAKLSSGMIAGTAGIAAGR